MNPTLGPIKRHTGVAGQFAYSTWVQYPGEPASEVTFVGSAYGGPVLMQTPGNPVGVWVEDPNRFGKFGPAWVREFFSPQEV